MTASLIKGQRMARKQYQPEVENDDGWTEWIRPLDGYKMACCDCDLVHNLQFDVDEEGRVIFRASRNVRSTAQLRRHSKLNTSQR